MKVSVHAVNFTVDRKLVDFIQERLSKLEKYYDKVVSADVFLKVEKTSEKENKVVEVPIQTLGKREEEIEELVKEIEYCIEQLKK